MNKTLFVLSIAFLAFTLTTTPCIAEEKDPEAAARQARIDRDEARVRVDEIEKREENAAAIDGVDAPELRADDTDMDAELAEEDDAERRLRDVEAVR